VQNRIVIPRNYSFRQNGESVNHVPSTMVAKKEAVSAEKWSILCRTSRTRRISKAIRTVRITTVRTTTRPIAISRTKAIRMAIRAADKVSS